MKMILKIGGFDSKTFFEYTRGGRYLNGNKELLTKFVKVS